MSRVIALSIGLALAIASPVAHAAVFRGLGHLPGYTVSLANDVSADGSVVIGFDEQSPTQRDEAFRWTEAEGMVSLGFLGGTGDGSIAIATSNDGTVVVGYGYCPFGCYTEAFRWTAETGMVGLGELPGSGDTSYAAAISADGAVIAGTGTIDSSGRGHAFRWTEATGMVDLGVLPGGTSDASGVSADGSVVVGGAIAAEGENLLIEDPFRWTQDGGMVSLGHVSDHPGATIDYAFARAVSDDGTVAVGYDAYFLGDVPVSEAFRWTAETGMVALGDLPGGEFYSGADAVSADGSVVVGESASDASAGTDDGVEAFIWDAAHGMRSLREVLVNEYGLDLAGWFPVYASAISPDGRKIAGMALNPQGDLEAYLVDLAPACSDGFDNDGDGLVDFPADPGCASADSDTERPACNDGIDNDGDGGIDFDGGAAANHGTPLGPPDAQCTTPYRRSELRACGLGAELAIPLGVVVGFAARRRRIGG